MITKRQRSYNYLKSIFTNKIVLICLALSFVYFISGYFNNLEFIVSAIALICFIFLPTQASFCILFFLHNFLTSDIVWNVGFTITIVGFTIITLVKFIIGVKNKKFNLNLKVLICFGLALLIGLLASINHSIYNGALLYLIYLPLIYLMFAMRSELDIKQIVNYMLFGFILSNLLSLLCFILPYYDYSCLLSGRFKAFTDNPNYLGMRAVFLVVFYFTLYLKNENSILKTLLIYLFSAVVVFSTQSKTSLILLALFTLIFVVLYLKQDFKKNIKNVLIFLLIGLILCCSCWKLLIIIIDRFVPDNTNVFSSLLTGRDEIWLMYWNECVKNPITILFGNGLISSEVFIPSQNITRTSHSLYLFLFYRFGIIGCIALGIGFYFIIKELVKNKTSFICSLPLLWYLLESLVDNTFLCFNITFLPLALLIMFDNKENNNFNNNSLKNTSKIKTNKVENDSKKVSQ